MTRVHAIRSKAALLMASALAAAGVLAGASPASAAAGDLTCVSTSSTSTFTPALRLQSQPDTVTFSNVLSDCTSTNGIKLTGATTPNVVGTGSINCLALGNLTGTGQFQWGARQISDFTWQTTGGLGVSFIFSGTITSGPLAGDSFQGVAPPISVLNLTTCLTTGLASLTYDVVWTFF